MLSFIISYPNVIIFLYFVDTLKKGIGGKTKGDKGETKGDFTDNSNMFIITLS
jgi:hypothetical protein